MDPLFAALKNRFDYILIDTPPISLVSDALLLRKYVDRTLIIIRQHHTKKYMVKNLEELYQNEELGNVNIIYYGMKSGGTYGYAVNYRYGYEQGYYTEEENNA
jgi:Mrp family chromosome partitioning ATPase